MPSNSTTSQLQNRIRKVISASSLENGVEHKSSDLKNSKAHKNHHKYHSLSSIIKKLSVTDALLLILVMSAFSLYVSKDSNDIGKIQTAPISKTLELKQQNNGNLNLKRQKSLLGTLKQQNKEYMTDTINEKSLLQAIKQNNDKLKDFNKENKTPTPNSKPLRETLNKGHSKEIKSDSKQSIDSYVKSFKPNNENLKHTKKRLFLSKHKSMIGNIYKEHNNDGSIPLSSLNWSNIVVILLTYDEYNASKLLQAQFDTWLKSVETGLDIVIITDISDARSDDEILHSMDKDKFNISIHRSSAINEMNRARHKVVDAFNHTITKYKNDDAKMYFLKVDPDSFLVAERLMDKVREMHEITYPHPVHFGRTSCANNKVTCHVLGGLYGMNKAGLEITMNYISENPEVYNTFVPNPTKREENFMVHEDYFMSYVFWKSTYYPKIGIRGISESQSINDDFISFHPIKNFLEMYTLHYLFHSGDELEDISVAQNRYKSVVSIMDFPKLTWNNDKLRFEISPKYANKAY